MSNLSDVIRILPPMKSGNELLSALEVLPEYDAAICDADAPVRLMALSDLYRVSAPVIKCKKTPRKKCSFVAEVKGKR